MFLLAAAALFAVFALNVGMGAFGGGPFLGDVGEMLLLFAASIAFVVAILKREAAEKDKKKTLRPKDVQGRKINGRKR